MNLTTEWINPIVVKELRQGLRTRIFWICFGLLLIVSMVIAVVAWAGSLDGGLSESGQEFFYAYFMALGAVHFFIIPYTAYRSLAREREEETWVLLSLTGIGARRVLRGKVGSFLAQAGLYASAVLPFMLFSYYLNGISLPTILTVIGLGVAWTLFLICAAVCAAAVGEGRLVRGLVHLLVLGGLLGATVFALTVGAVLVFEESVVSRSELHTGVLIGLWLMSSYGLLLFEAAASQLSLATEDSAKGPRLALLFQVVGSILLVLFAWEQEGRDRMFAMIGQSLLQLHLFVVGVFFVSTPVHVHEVHRRRSYWPLLRPGAPSAFRFIALLITLVTVVWLVVFESSPTGSSGTEGGALVIVAIAAFSLLYLSVPLGIVRGTNLSVLSSPIAVRVVIAAGVALGSSLPLLVSVLLGRGVADPEVNVFNPFVTIGRYFDMGWSNGGFELLPLITGAALVGTLAADRILAWRERAGTPARRELGTS